MQSRLLATLEKLFSLPAANLQISLAHAADLVSEALRADKLDAFLYDPARDTLVAIGASSQPLSALQRRHGLDVLPVANGGRTVRAFQTGETFVTGRLDEDRDEVRGIREVLEVRSVIAVPITIGEERRGVLLASSRQRDFFDDDDVRVAEILARWVGVIAHRAELVEQIASNALEQGRRAVADELVTVLAHDLRNHLSPLAMRLELLRMRAERDGRTAELGDLRAAIRSMARLSALVADILDVARIDQGLFQLELERVNLSSLVRDAASVLGSEQHVVQVRAPEDVLVPADPARLRQCVENLVSNAIAHSPSSAPVLVNVGRARHESGTFAFVDVIDEGPGVPPEMLPRMFQRFVTGERQRGGLGLGLYLAKRIAVGHGGDLTVDSPPGRGARFSLRLPSSP